MTRLLLTLALVTLPGSAAAAAAPAFVSGSSILIATTTPANVYAIGGTVAVTTPIKGDFTAAGGSLSVEAAVGGDLSLAGGSLHINAPVAGDARLMGGSITLSGAVGGDLVAFGGSVVDSGGGGANVLIAAGDVSMTKGAAGPVTVYGNTISLGGTFLSDVEVIAGSRVTLLPGAVIRGELRYQAPEQANIPSSATIAGGVHYTGASYLPTSKEARAIALASFGVFLFVKILGALILAGLLAGIFPTFVDRVVTRATHVSVRRALLTLLLGFGVLVATPVLLLILAVTFVGLGLALILGLAYLLLIPLAFIYAAIVIGSYLAHDLFKRTELRWSDAVFGMLVLFLVWSLPYIGGFVTALAIVYMLGVLTHLVYRFAFPRESEGTAV
jgi:hypothetical protein